MRILPAIFCVAVASCQPIKTHSKVQAGWTCGDETLQGSWEKIESQIRDSANAQELANAVLCLPESKAVTDYLGAHLDESVEFSTFGTGDLEEERETLSQETAKRRIRGFGGSDHYEYSAQLDSEGNISLDATSEACVEGFTLKYREGRGWVISESGGACD